MDFFLLFFLGTLFGSFSNVYFYRFCQDLSVVFPNSFCPQCRASIRWYDNVPLLSYLILRGRCRSCRHPIPWSYPLAEFLCGALFLSLYVLLKGEPAAVIAAFLFLYFINFLIAGTDLATFFETGKQYGIIPDQLVALLAAGAFGFSFFNPYIGGEWQRSLWGAAAGLSVSFSIRWIGNAILKKEALGMGDVKLIGALGLIFGWQGVFSTLFFGSLAGSAVSLILMARHKIHRESALPFGPFLALGSVSGFFL